MNQPTATSASLDSIVERTSVLFREQHQNIIRHTDQLFVRLMLIQWVFGVGLAVWISPLAWAGAGNQIHLHVWAAVLLGGLVTCAPVALASLYPGEVLTRHVVAMGQMFMSALLIHLTGGRIETHFHVFGSLAILAFYRDWRVLISASLVVYVDHLLRGFLWPQSVYGVLSAPIWRSLEHAGWVIFEVTFLVIAIRKSLSEMQLVAERQARVEALKDGIEVTVAERTADLTREVSERRQAEERLLNSQAQLAQAQQIARLGSWEWIIAVDRLACSEETMRLFGREAGSPEPSLEQFLESVHRDDLARVRKIFDEAKASREPFTCDYRIALPDGMERIIQSRGEVGVNNHGEAFKFIGTSQDVTESRRSAEALHHSEEKLRQSQKMEAVGRLAGGVAHDFNNLLTVIGGYSAMTLKTLKPDDALRRNLEEIQRASDRAVSLTGQLLAFSRKQVLQPRVLQLNEVVQGMDKMLRRLIGEDVELTTVLDPALEQVKADPGQIEQVILNLAVNARDAMPRGGRLTISTSNACIDQKSSFRERVMDPGRYVMLAISDNGVGMTEEIKSHLFEPFFTTKGLGKGTGLGLATCYGIVCQSGGDIRVYSEANSGTTFKIYLPAVAVVAAPEPKSSAEPSPLPAGKESILLVEDDSAVRRLAYAILRGRGYQVQESSSAIDALEIIRKNPGFDLVLTDVIMPQMSGKELCDLIKAQIPRTRVLLMSGYTDDALAHHGVLNEGISFLEKPFSPSRLSQKVREVLDAPGGVSSK